MHPVETSENNKPAQTCKDEKFLEVMKKEFHQDEAKDWIAPLAFTTLRQPLTSNHEQAL